MCFRENLRLDLRSPRSVMRLLNVTVLDHRSNEKALRLPFKEEEKERTIVRR